MQLIKAPFTYVSKSTLGDIYRPYIIVQLYSKLIRSWLPIEMVIDSGADYTLLPKKYAEILGIDLQADCQKQVTLGVGGAESVYQYKKLPIKINSWKNIIPVGFIQRNNIPGLLGRLRCLELLKVTFEKLESTFKIDL